MVMRCSKVSIPSIYLFVHVLITPCHSSNLPRVQAGEASMFTAAQVPNGDVFFAAPSRMSEVPLFGFYTARPQRATCVFGIVG